MSGAKAIRGQGVAWTPGVASAAAPHVVSKTVGSGSVSIAPNVLTEIDLQAPAVDTDNFDDGSGRWLIPFTGLYRFLLNVTLVTTDMSGNHVLWTCQAFWRWEALTIDVLIGQDAHMEYMGGENVSRVLVGAQKMFAGDHFYVKVEQQSAATAVSTSGGSWTLEYIGDL